MSSNNKKTAEQCESCGGRVVARRVEVYRRRKAVRVLFERVPARVCRECGSRIFDAPAVEAMEHILSHPPKGMKSRKIAIASP